LQLLRRFHVEINVRNVWLVFSAIKEALAFRIEYFVGNIAQYRVAANEQSVFLSGEECQHQLRFITWD
jgi:hypothetical protein